MSFLKDALSIFKKSELVFMEKMKESDEVYSFLFKKTEDLAWNSGQHGLFTITHRKVKGSTKPFTVSSTPNEDVVKITTRIGEDPSDFKSALMELEAGMKISMSGPVGSFYLKEENPSLLIAVDIGITPFRAMIKQLETEENELAKQVTLLYLDTKGLHIFNEELTNSEVDVKFLTKEDDLFKEVDIFSEKHQDNGQYFIAGSRKAVNSVAEHLKSNNVPKSTIKKNIFF